MILKQQYTRTKRSASLDKNLKQSGNVFLALFGAVAVVGLIGGTAAGIMQGPMKAMSDVSARAKSESEIIANTKMAIMAIANIDTVNPSANRDCDNDGIVEAYPFSAARSDTVGPAPIGGGYLPSEIDTTRWIDAWGNSYTYCIWDHGTLINDASCGGVGQNRRQGFDTSTYTPTDVNKQTFIAILSAGPNRRYETTCQDWAAADANANGDLGDSGDTPLVLKPDGSDDIVMSYTYAEAAMATSSNWRIQSNAIDTAEIPEEDIEVGGNTGLGDGVKTTVAGGIEVLGGLKLATDPGDDTMTGACNPANDQALRINTGGSIDVLEICASGLWQPVSNTSVTGQGCVIETLNIADGGNAWLTNATELHGPENIKIVGQYAYVVSSNGDSLTVIEISGQTIPIVRGRVTDATRLNGASGLDIKANYAYVTSTQNDSLTVVDISNPVSPIIANGGNAVIQNAALLNGATDVKISGDYAYVVSNQGIGHFTVIDISNPLIPVIANSGNAFIGSIGSATAIEIRDNFAYVTTADNQFIVINISNPLTPVIANGGAAIVTDAVKLSEARDLKILGDYAYVVSRIGDSLTTIDISDPLNPVIADGGEAWITDVSLDGARGIDITGNFAIVTAGTRVTAIDVSNPLNPTLANTGLATVQDATRLNGARDIYISNRYAYVVSFTGNSITVVDLNCDPEREDLLSGRDIGFDYALGNCLEGNDGPAILQDSITPPGTTGGNFANITSDGRYIYFSDGNLTAYSFDGYELTEVATIIEPRGSIWSDGNYIYKRDGNTIKAFFFDGSNFNLLDSLTLGTITSNLSGDGNYIYLSSDNLIRAIQFDGTNLSLVASSTEAVNFTSIWIHQNRLYTVGLNVLTISEFDGINFNIIHSETSMPSANSIYVDDNYIYTADTGHLYVWQYKDGKINLIHDRTSDPNIFYDIYGDGRYLYVQYNIESRIMEFNGSEFNVLQTFNHPGAERGRVYHDGQFFYIPSADALSVYSGYECTKAGFSTLGNAITKDYDANQFIIQENDTGLTAETYGTSILLDSNEFADEAGIAFNVSSVIGDDETPSAAVTALRKSELDDAAALIFKTQDDDNKLKNRMAIDANGNLGLGTSLPFDVSANIQIGDLASTGSRAFDINRANCVAANNGPINELASIPLIGNRGNIYTDDTYIYVNNAGILRAYTFDGTALTEIANHTLSTPSTSASALWGDGRYLYATTGGIVTALSFDGSTFTELALYPDAFSQVYNFWTNGEYIYASANFVGVLGFKFDGVNFTNTHRSASGWANDIWGDDNYIYAAHVNDGLKAYTYDNETITEVARINDGLVRAVYSDGTYIYTVGDAINIYTFDGSSFTKVGGNNLNSGYAIRGDGKNIYVSRSTGEHVYEFNGTALTELAGPDFVAGSTLNSIHSDGNYLYAATSSDLRIFSGFECTKVDGWVGPDQGLLASDPEILGFDSMASNCTAANNGPLAEVTQITLSDLTNPRSLIANSLNVYATNLGRTKAFDFDGTEFTEIASRALGSNDRVIFHRDRIINSRSSFGLYAWKAPIFQFGIPAPWNPGGYSINSVWGDNNYIYVDETTNGNLLALTYDGGNTFTEIASTPATGIRDIAGDGQYIYTASGTTIGIVAYSFDGTALSQITSLDTPGGANSIWADGDYIYVGELNQGLRVYTFNGTVFTEVAHDTFAGSGETVWGDGQYLYVAAGSSGLRVYDFDGTTLTLVASDATISPIQVWGNGAYVFGADSNGTIIAYSGFECTETDNAIDGSIGYFGLESETEPNLNILYSTGFDIKGTNISGDNQTDILNIDANGKTTITQDNVNIEDEAAAFNFLTNSDSNIFNTLEINRYRGTRDAGTIVQNGDLIGGLIWGGYSGFATSPTDHAAIYAKVNGAVSPNNIPLDLILSTDSAGRALNSSDITISSTGNVGINTNNPAWPLHVNGRISVDEGFRIGPDNQCSTGRDLAFLRYNGATLSLEHCGGDGNWSHISEPIRDFATIDPIAANCLKNNGGPFQEITSDGSQEYYSIVSDGTYYYYGSSDPALGNTLVASTFNGSGFDEISVFDINGAVDTIWTENGYLYVAAEFGGLQIYSFDGLVFTLISTENTYNSDGLIVTDSRIFSIENNGLGSSFLNAYSFNGITITHLNRTSLPGAPRDIAYDGTYLHVALSDDGLYAYSFDGTTFTQIADYEGGAGSSSANRKQGIQYVNGHLFLSEEFSGITILSFDGTSYTEIDTYNSWAFLGAGSQGVGYIWSDGAYYYAETNEFGAGPQDRDFIHAFTFDGTTLTPFAHLRKTVNASDSRQGRLNGYGSFIFDSTGNSGMNVFAGFECLVADNPGEQIIEWTGSRATEEKILASDGGLLFGDRVSIDGQYAVIGAYLDDDNGGNSGSAYIFDVTTGAQIHKLTASDGAAGDFFGISVSIDGQYAVIGAFFNDDNGSNSGSAYIFDVTTGAQIHKLTASDGAVFDFFGQSVSIDGQYAVIGAANDDDKGSNSGSAYIFDVTTGAQIHKLTASDGAAGDAFGASVSIDGQYAIISSLLDGDQGLESGSAYIFDVTTGTQIHKLTASDGAAFDAFGASVSIDGQYAIIGSNNGFDTGSAYIFDVTTGAQLHELNAINEAEFNNFGRSVSIHGQYAVIGASGDDDGGSSSGSAYIYSGNWSERFKAETTCFPDPLFIDNISNAVANTAVTSDTITIEGVTQNCPLSFASESGTIDIIKNSVSTGSSQTTVNHGDTIQLEIQSSATAGASFNNILTIGDERAMFSVTTAP